MLDKKEITMQKVTGNLGLVLGCLSLLLAACGPTTEIEVGCDVDALNQAIHTANNEIDHTTIILDEDCLYNLSDVNTTIDFQEEFTGESGNTGLPPISTPITIEGNKATIQRLDTAPEMRFFFITTSGELTLSEVTLNNGLVQSGQIHQRNGGAIYNRGVLNLVESHVLDSYAEDSGGGIFNDEMATLVIDDNSISFNQAGRYGGAITNLGTLEINGYSIINNNLAVTGSGGAIFNTGALTITSGHVNSNQATVRGGAIASESGSFVSLEGVLFEENIIGGNGGGALNLSESTFTITDCTFDQNEATVGASGGAILISGSDGSIEGGTTFLGNSSSADGGAVFIIGDSEIVIDMTTFQSNTAAARGGAISNYTHGMVVNIRNSTFSGNSALSGGGIANGGDISVRKSLISANSSTEAGAGIYNAGSLFQLINSTVS
jgi:predicted outer membrane repeat protein